MSAELPGGGWPAGTLVELLQQQPGIGEMRLLRPALQACAERRIVLLQPPHPPQALALAALGLPPSQLLWLRTSRSADALWAARADWHGTPCGTTGQSIRQQRIRAAVPRQKGASLSRRGRKAERRPAAARSRTKKKRRTEARRCPPDQGGTGQNL